MALLWVSGAELRPTAAGIEYTSIVTTAPAIETSTVRSGTAAYRINNSGAIEGFRNAFTTAQGEFTAQAFVRFVALPTTTSIIGGFRTTGAIKCCWRITTGGLLQFWNDEDGAQIGSNSTAISLNTWYRLTAKYNSTTLSATTCEAHAYTDSPGAASFWDASGTIDITATPTNFGMYMSATDATLDYIVDDCSVSDATGSFENTFIGECEMICLRPNAAGDFTTWARGGTDSGANWSQTSEVPPDGVTSYIEENTNNANPDLCSDDFNVDATPSALASDDVIKAVLVGGSAAVDTTTGADPDIVWRCKATASGTVEESATLDCNSATYQGPAPLPADSNYKLVMYDLPGGSTTVWTKTELDTMQIGVRLAITDTHFARVSAIWAYIVHKPAVAGGTSILRQMMEHEGG